MVKVKMNVIYIFINNTDYLQLLLIITLGFGLTLTVQFFSYLIHAFGEHCKQLCIYLISRRL